MSVSIEDLTKACAEVLAAEPSIERCAIPNLHLRNAHPSSLVPFLDVLDGKIPGYDRWFRALYEINAILLLSLIRQEAEWSGDPLPPRADVLFISHFLEREQAHTGKDIYFGTLPAEVQSAGRSVALAHINHTQLRWKDYATSWERLDVPRVILNRTCGPRRDFALISQLIMASGSLVRSHWRDRLTENVATWAALGALSPSSFASLRIGAQISRLLKILRPRWLVSTFEGHAWERLAFRAAHDAGSKTIGYHHTIVFPKSYAISKILGNNFDPDVIMTAGETGADWFRETPIGQSRKVRVLGSTRTPEHMGNIVPDNNASDCLVAPEGIASEALTLIRLAEDAAKLVPNVRFRIRLHPVLGIDVLLAARPELKRLPANVVWSPGSLAEDIRSCRTILYRGSTVAITAVSAGVRPIYAVDGNDYASIDPLESIERRIAIDSGRELADVLVADLMEDESSRSRHVKAAQDYCRRYFTPLDPTAFEDVINAPEFASAEP